MGIDMRRFNFLTSSSDSRFINLFSAQPDTSQNHSILLFRGLISHKLFIHSTFYTVLDSVVEPAAEIVSSANSYLRMLKGTILPLLLLITLPTLVNNLATSIFIYTVDLSQYLNFNLN
jgi:hypothetical protein